MRFKVGLLLCTLLSLTPAIASSDATERGKELIDQAADKTNLFELPSFRMSANVSLDNLGKPISGTYTFMWNGPEQWREEIVFPGYSEVRVGEKGLVYLKRSRDHTPYQISQLYSTVGLGAREHAGLRDGEAIKGIHQETLAGATAACIEITGHGGYTREVCVDQVSGAIRRDKQGFREADFLPAGSKVFPRSMALVERGKVLIDVRVTELNTQEPPPTALFEPPDGSVSRPGCAKPTTPRKTKDLPPRYPAYDKIARNQGFVAVYATIDATGMVRNPKVIAGARPSLDQSALEAIREWRYTPATCNGSPVEVEIVIEVRYSLPR